MKLSKRLTAIAQLVPQGSMVADIGTDHGMLPCYLAKEGLVKGVIGADVNQSPLDSAKKNVDDYRLNEVIQLRLGNGLEVLSSGEVDVVTISGMGGGTMVGILEARPDVVEKLKRIIVQPNVDWVQVRQWANEKGWHIVDEDLVHEEGRFYQVIALEPGIEEKMDWVEQLIGPVLIKKKHPLLIQYLQEEYQGDKKVMESLAKSQSMGAKQKQQEIQEKWRRIKEVIVCQFNVEML